MCGICGIYGLEDKNLIERMADTLTHRGPDEEGFYSGKNISMGHKRLSIIDLETGRQPIHNEDESIWVVFNGEIYNYMGLTQDLESKGHRFYTNADTEVLVHLYEEYGNEFINRLNGMFVFAIWDSNTEKLLLARDFLGVKPLYYTRVEDKFLFASEIKAILEYEELKREVNTESVYKFLTFHYVPGEDTIFKGIKKLPPSHFLECVDGRIRIKRYWDLKEAITRRTDEHNIKLFRKLLEESVKMRLIADVPVGAFLSGGIDSSAITAIASEFVDEPLKTFSVGFGEDKPHELNYAQIVSDFLGTDHQEVIVDDESEVINVLPKLTWHYDEPMGESAAIPTYFVSSIARKKVKVALAGEAGDELFAGYEVYPRLLLLHKYWKAPNSMKKLISYFLRFMPQDNKLIQYLTFLSVSDYLGNGHVKVNSNFEKSDLKNLCSDNFYKAIENCDSDDMIKPYSNNPYVKEPLNQMALRDVRNILADCFFMKADKATMAQSIEERVPFEDKNIAEFSFSIPPRLKLHWWTGKYILKKAMSGSLPAEIIKRKKMGYSTPILQWMHGEVGEVVQQLLSDSETAKHGYFRQDKMNQLGDNVKQIRTNHTAFKIWMLFAFELWYQVYIINEGEYRNIKL
jgi:asparagine synthase (glutamine-hydrolysing)